MGDLNQGSKDQNADKKTDGKDQAQDISGENKDFIGSWIPGHVYYAQEENLSTFCSWPESLWETKIKSDELIELVKYSGQPSAEAVAWVLLEAFSQIYHEKQDQKSSAESLEKFC